MVCGPALYLNVNGITPAREGSTERPPSELAGARRDGASARIGSQDAAVQIERNPEGFCDLRRASESFYLSVTQR